MSFQPRNVMFFLYHCKHDYAICKCFILRMKIFLFCTGACNLRQSNSAKQCLSYVSIVERERATYIWDAPQLCNGFKKNPVSAGDCIAVYLA